MATENTDVVPLAMKGLCSETYLTWIEAIGDYMQSSKSAGELDNHTVPNLGWLIYSLAESAKEMAELELRAARGD